MNIRNAHSGYKSVTCGVPQGSILGPLLFILFTNDMPHCLKHCNASMYADDSTVYVIGKDVKLIESILNADANNVFKWCSENKLYINVEKTKCMLLTTPQKRASQTSTDLAVRINNKAVPNSNCEQVLGMYIHCSLDWGEHVSYLCKCINYRLCVLRKIRKCLSVEARAIYCNSYVLPYLDYCSTIWGNTTEYNLQKLSGFKSMHADSNLMTLSLGQHYC